MPPSRPYPELSPTPPTLLSSTSNPAPSASVRRNLFSGHLSRRPASGSQPPPHAQSQSGPQSPERGQYEPSALPHMHTRRIHQRSVSTPSLSPSPPRLSPSNQMYSGHSNQPTLIPPPPPKQTTSPPRNGLGEGYDPMISPNRPMSPRSSVSLFPNSSIIALNPLTGRPVLPRLPVLPGRLRLTDSDGDLEDDGEDVNATGGHHVHGHDEYAEDAMQNSLPQAYHAQDHGQTPRYGSYTHMTMSEAEHAGHAQAAMAAAAAEAEADEERRDRERIEKLLRDMMARQRARAKGQGPASIPAGGSRAGVVERRANRARLRRQHMSEIEVEVGVDHDGYLDDHDTEHGSSPGYGARGHDRAAESEAEKEELMGLITSSLRREVARAEHEGWMFGDSSAIRMGSVGEEIGVYD